MAQTYAKTPSEILNIEDEYTSFCFDEACLYIRTRLEKGEDIHFEVKYSSFSDLYKNLEL